MRRLIPHLVLLVACLGALVVLLGVGCNRHFPVDFGHALRQAALVHDGETPGHRFVGVVVDAEVGEHPARVVARTRLDGIHRRALAPPRVATGLVTGGPYTVAATANGFEGQTVSDIQTTLQGNTGLTFALTSGSGMTMRASVSSEEPADCAAITRTGRLG